MQARHRRSLALRRSNPRYGSERGSGERLRGGRWRGEQGQTLIFVVLVLGIFLLAFLGFATDYTNVWMRHQAAQTAADSACVAGAMDVYLASAGASTETGPGFTVGTDFNCTAGSTAAPCKYAAINRYDSAGLVANQDSNLVAVTFPSSVPGVPPLDPKLYANAAAGFKPYMAVTVTDRVKVIFAYMASGKKTVDVKAYAQCGLVPITSQIPIVILHPTASNALSVGGSSSIVIQAGPKKSIQVNSRDSAALNAGTINLAGAGPSLTGADLGVFGGPTMKPGGVNVGSTGHYISPATPTSDPYASFSAPSQPLAALPPTPVVFNVAGCPNPRITPGGPSGIGCQLYHPGSYSSGLAISSQVALFEPGLYWISGSSGLNFDQNSTIRPSTTPGDGTGGVVFYLAGCTTTCLTVSSNSGNKSVCTNVFSNGTPNNCIVSYFTSGSGTVDGTLVGSGGTTTMTNPAVQCPSGLPPTVALPAAMDGNVLQAPCTGAFGDPGGQYRGFLFFMDRSIAGNLNWGGGGSFLLNGILYAHQNSGYGATLSLSGGSGAGTVLGNIAADTLSLGGSSSINMQINPNASFTILKVQLLK